VDTTFACIMLHVSLIPISFPNDLMCWKIVQRERLFSPDIDHAEHLPSISFLHRLPISHGEHDIQGHTGRDFRFLVGEKLETGEEF
jgi:hypothetical protein